MALKVELKPGERIVVGRSVITNGDARIRFFIEGDAPILREKDIVTPTSVKTPAENIYLSVQLMYLAGDIVPHHEAYFQLVGDFLQAAPSALPYIAEINQLILNDDLYKALRAAKRLIAYEAELVSGATGAARPAAAAAAPPKAPAKKTSQSSK